MRTKRMTYLAFLLGVVLITGFPSSVGGECLELLSNVDTTPWLTAVDAAGNFAYLGCEGHFGIIDVSDPASPTVTGHIPIDLRLTDLTVHGDHVYLLVSGRLQVIDATDPYRLQLLAYDNDVGGKYLSVHDGYLYVAPAGDADLAVFDLSRPDEPDHIADFSCDGEGVIKSLTTGGGFAYMISRSTSGDCGLVVVDVRHPERPVEVSASFFYEDYDFGDSTPFIDIAVDGSGTAYLTAWQDFACCPNTAVELVDIRNPLTPEIVTSTSPPEEDLYGRGRVAAADGFVYLTSPSEPWEAAYVWAIDVRNRTRPSWSPRIQSLGTAEDIVVANGLVFVVDFLHGLSIYRACGVLPDHHVPPGKRGPVLTADGGLQ